MPYTNFTYDFKVLSIFYWFLQAVLGLGGFSNVLNFKRMGIIKELFRYDAQKFKVSALFCNCIYLYYLLYMIFLCDRFVRPHPWIWARHNFIDNNCIDSTPLKAHLESGCSYKGPMVTFVYIWRVDNFSRRSKFMLQEFCRRSFLRIWLL